MRIFSEINRSFLVLTLISGATSATDSDTGDEATTPVIAQADKPSTKSRRRSGAYYPNTEPLANDEMRVIALGVCRTLAFSEQTDLNNGYMLI
mgnify:CR=1 FL=1